MPSLAPKLPPLRFRQTLPPQPSAVHPATPSPIRPATDDSTASLPSVSVVPEQILNDDEVVLLLIKPSILYIFYTSFFFVTVTLLMGMLIARVASFSTTYFSSTTFATAAVLISLARLIWALLVWTSHTYMLTNQRIVTIKGVLNVHIFQAHLRKIQKTDMFRPLLFQILGTGTLAFSTAAAADSFDSTWVMIARPREVHEQVVAAINKMQSK